MHETQREIDNNEDDEFEISTTKSENNNNNVMESESNQVHDSSLDYKGRIPLRTSTGSWKASFFILAIEFSEIMCYFGIATNMITYMTQVMHQDLKTAANSVNLWSGVATVMPLVGGFLADSYVGRYSMILFSAFLYVMGLGIFTLAQYVPSLKPCKTTSTSSPCENVSNVHKVVFFIGAYLIAMATGGYKPCLESFGADQFDENNPKERKQKMSFFNWWNVAIGSGLFFGVTLIVYMQQSVSWGIGYLILAITMGFTAFIFVLGRPFYRYRATNGSPLTPLFQAFVVAVRNRHLPYPSSPSLLYETPKSAMFQGQLLSHTNRLRCFDKAAIVVEHGELIETTRKRQISPWRLATVTRVEELKLLIVMLPMWLTSLMFGIGNALGPTFFIKQGSAMNRKVFKHIEVPPPFLGILSAIGMIVSASLYDRVLVPSLRKATGNERGINILTRIGIGMIILIISMMIAALVEKVRLNEILQGNNMQIHIFWLAPQIFIMGIGDGFSLVGLQEYFYDQVPESMRSLGIGFYLSVTGVGSFATSLLITIVDYVTRMNGGKTWIGIDVNHSRLDYFYWLLMVIFGLNMCIFVILANNYKYKKVQPSVYYCDDGKRMEVVNV